MKLLKGGVSSFALAFLSVATILAIGWGVSGIENQSALAASGDTKWAKTVSSAPGSSRFTDVATDDSGNSYAVGYILGTSQFDFGNNVEATGASTAYNAVLVKYDIDGTPQWAKMMISVAKLSDYYGVALDDLGNIYVTGRIQTAGTYDFGNGVSAVGSSTGDNIVFIKYNSSGLAQWAKVMGTFSEMGLSTDSSGNIFVVGEVAADVSYNFGDGVTVAATVNHGHNTLVVKYNSSGVAQWAKSNIAISGVSATSGFYDVTADENGDIYAVGEFYGNYVYDFGSSVTIHGVTGGLALIVKYSSSGVPQWANKVSGDGSYFDAVVNDGSGGVYVCGSINIDTAQDFGNGVTTTGGDPNYSSGVIAKYNYSGLAQWATSTVATSEESYFYDITIDPSGNLYCGGEFWGSSTPLKFSDSISITGVYADDYNFVVAKFSSSGVSEWARTATSGSNVTGTNGVSTDGLGNVYAAGLIYGNGAYGFGSDVTAAGKATGANVVLIKYEGEVVAQSESSTPLAGDIDPVSSATNISETGTILATATTSSVQASTSGQTTIPGLGLTELPATGISGI